MSKHTTITLFITLLSIFISACSSLISVGPEVALEKPPGTHVLNESLAPGKIPGNRTVLPSILSTPPQDVQPSETSALNPRRGESEVYRISSQLFSFDGIRPVYDPVFGEVSEANIRDNELVMGVVINGEAKAYPVNMLKFREMVNVEIAGIPILVTW
jgi:hypothetical protein